MAKPEVLTHHVESPGGLGRVLGLTLSFWFSDLVSKRMCGCCWFQGPSVPALSISFSSPRLLTPDLANIHFLGEHLQDLPHSSNTVLEKFIPHIWQFYLVQWQENVFFGPLSLFCWASSLLGLLAKIKCFAELLTNFIIHTLQPRLLDILFLFNVAICRHLLFICFVTLT